MNFTLVKLQREYTSPLSWKNIVWQLPEEIREGNTSKNWQKKKKKNQLGVLGHFLGIPLNYTSSTTTSSGQRSQDNCDNLICTLFHLGCMRIAIPSSVYAALCECYFSDETVLKIPFIQQIGRNIPQVDIVLYIFVVLKNW